MTSGRPPRGGDDGERPPVGGSWTALYAAVVSSLAILVALLWLLSRAFQ